MCLLACYVIFLEGMSLGRYIRMLVCNTKIWMTRNWLGKWHLCITTPAQSYFSPHPLIYCPYPPALLPHTKKITFWAVALRGAKSCRIQGDLLESTDRGTNKNPPCSTGLSPLWGCCPASPHSYSQSHKAG